MSDITVVCYRCGGGGVYNRTTIDGSTPIDPCPVCGGAGTLVAMSYDDQSIKKDLAAIKKTLKDILAKLT
jgi:DnaJ-class molecular chaperone